MEISEVEKSYIGKVIDIEKFNELFEPNGFQGIEKHSYRFYMCEDEDITALHSSYEKDDPRFFDFYDDEEDSESDEEDEWKVSYLDYPYPHINVYAELKVTGSEYIIASFDICKAYDTGNPNSFTHSYFFTDFEAEYVTQRLSCILK